MLISHTTLSHALVSARLDSLLRSEGSADYSLNRIEERLGIKWHTDTTRGALQMDMRHEYRDSFIQDDADNELQIQQLFFARNIKQAHYILGRFNRSDNLGFYMLDGLSIQYRSNHWQTDIHGGRPLQIEDYRRLDTDMTRGLDIRHQGATNNPYLKNIRSHIGWQQLSGDGSDKQNYLHLGVNADNKKSDDEMPGLSVFIQGTYLHELGKFESIYATVQHHEKKQGLNRFSYRLWQPEKAQLSFREKFYHVYANGRQSSLQGEFFTHGTGQGEYYLRARKVWHQVGHNGYGISLGIKNTKTRHNRPLQQLQWDFLNLDQDYIHSLYYRMDKSTSSNTIVSVTCALQYAYNTLSGNQQTAALEGSMKKMLHSDLFLTLFGRYIYKENAADEYRIDIRLSYRFGSSLWGSRQ